MIRIWHSNSASDKKIKSEKLKRTSQSSSQKNIRSNNLGNDIFVSRSGQAKIDNLDSCLSLCSCDFIVF